MKKVQIKDLGIIITGTTPSTKNKNNYSNNNYMFVMPGDLKNQRYINHTDKHISDFAYNNITRHLHVGDIAIDCIGADMGNVGIIANDCISNQQINTISQVNTKICNPVYLYYLLKTKKDYLHLIGSNGATMPIINKSMFENIELLIHDLPTQQHIVDTIGSVDDLIEKNEEIMQKFNTYLQSQYKSIICAYKEKINLGSFVERISIPADNNEWANEQVIDLSSMPQDNICITTSSNGSDFTTNIKKLEEDTLLYGSIRPYFHKCGFTTDIKYVAGTVHNFKAINKKLLTYILAVISSSEFHDFTNTNSQGTKMPIINWETFIKYEVCNLNEKDIEYFYNNTYPIYEYIKKLIKQNKKLLEIKNQLLNKFFD